MTGVFKVVFDLATTPDRWWHTVGWMFILPLVGFLSIFIPEKVRNSALYHGPKGMAATVFGLAFCMFTGLIAISTALSHFQQKASYEALERNGQLTVLEGCLQNFHPMPHSGHELERIKVAGHQFSYSDFDESAPVFNNTEAYGGPIHSDSAVKLWSSGNAIIKLAVRDHACPPARDGF